MISASSSEGNSSNVTIVLIFGKLVVAKIGLSDQRIEMKMLPLP